MKKDMKKTKVMQIAQKNNLNITIKDQTFQEVEEFKYLGSMLTTN